MHNRRIFYTPFRSFVVLSILVSVYYLFLLFDNYASVSGNFMLMLALQGGITLAILLAETFVYWYLRKYIANRSWCWAHVITTYAALIILPLLFALVLFFTPDFQEQETWFSFYRTLLIIRRGIFWACVLIGHIFFIQTIIKGINLKKKIAAVQGEDEGIFSDFRS